MATWEDDPTSQQGYRKEAEDWDFPATAYTTAHDATEADAITSGGGHGQYYFYSEPSLIKRFYIIRVALWFNTSSIDDTAALRSANLKLMLRNNILEEYYDSSFNWYLRIKGGSDLNALTAGEVENYASLLTAGNVIESLYADDLTDSYVEHNFTIPLWFINKTGNTVFSFSHSKDESATPPDYSGTSMSERVDIGRLGDNEPILTINHGDPGFIFTEGDKFHFTSKEREQKILGVDTTTNATAGHLFVEGNYIHFVSQNGDERRQMGKLTNRWGYVAGHIWIDDMWIYYIDSSGYERKLGTWMLGQSHLGVDTILHA